MVVSGVDISIKKSDRKTVSIFVERDGSVSAIVPEKLSAEEIEKVINAKEYQIHKNLAEWHQLNERAILREYVNGQSFLYLGRNYKLQLVEEPIGKLIFSKGVFTLSKLELDDARNYFIDFYKAKLRMKIKPIIQFYQSQLGVKPKDINVMELQNRWASCSANGNVNFHWKCAMAPIDVINYIVVHELTHLIHLNHKTAFWNELDKVYPNYEKQKDWLKMNGAGMDL